MILSTVAGRKTGNVGGGNFLTVTIRGGGGSGTKLQTQGRWGGSIFGRDAV